MPTYIKLAQQLDYYKNLLIAPFNILEMFQYTLSKLKLIKSMWFFCKAKWSSLKWILHCDFSFAMSETLIWIYMSLKNLKTIK